MLGEGPDEQESKSTDPRAYPNKVRSSARIYGDHLGQG